MSAVTPASRLIWLGVEGMARVECGPSWRADWGARVASAIAALGDRTHMAGPLPDLALALGLVLDAGGANPAHARAWCEARAALEAIARERAGA